MAIIGQLLLWVGFISGALATVFREEIEADPWSTINWTWYGGSVAVIVCGVVAIRYSKSLSKSDSSQAEANLDILKKSLEQLIVNVESLKKELPQMSPQQMLQFIDTNLTNDFSMFADSRQSIADKYGLSVFAETMSQFAAGERAVNRAWCAAADRYVDEVAICIERAGAFLHETKHELDEAAANDDAP